VTFPRGGEKSAFFPKEGKTDSHLLFEMPSTEGKRKEGEQNERRKEGGGLAESRHRKKEEKKIPLCRTSWEKGGKKKGQFLPTERKRGVFVRREKRRGGKAQVAFGKKKLQPFGVCARKEKEGGGGGNDLQNLGVRRERKGPLTILALRRGKRKRAPFSGRCKKGKKQALSEK